MIKNYTGFGLITWLAFSFLILFGMLSIARDIKQCVPKGTLDPKCSPAEVTCRVC